jgi:hypothetical protein
MAQRFVAVNLTPEAREQLRALSFRLTGSAGRRVSLSDAVTAAVKLTERHPEEVIALLVESNGGTT